MSKNIFIRAGLIIIIVALVFSFSGCSIIDRFFGRSEPTSQFQESTTYTTAPTVSTTQAPPTESTSLPTTEAPTSAGYEEEQTKVWAKQDVNVRQKPTTDSKKVGVLHEGNGIIRIGKTANGWSKVIFDGGEAYISTSYLTEKEPAKTASSDRILVNPYSDLWYLVIVDSKTVSLGIAV